jgi:hypothetical protein
MVRFQIIMFCLAQQGGYPQQGMQQQGGYPQQGMQQQGYPQQGMQQQQQGCAFVFCLLLFGFHFSFQIRPSKWEAILPNKWAVPTHLNKWEDFRHSSR